jgi:hypothetical protein
VNPETAVDPAELPWPETAERVLRHPKLHLAVEFRGEMTGYSGLVLAQQGVRRVRITPRIDAALHLFKRHVSRIGSCPGPDLHGRAVHRAARRPGAA